MKLKEEFNLLVNTVKNVYRGGGQRITNEAIGKKMGLSRSYFSGLLGGSEEVKQKHIDDFKAHFSQELKNAYIPQIQDKVNPERALLLAMVQDYAEWKAQATGQSFQEVKAELKKKANLILSDLQSWLPEV